jgi:hypothetical protein
MIANPAKSLAPVGDHFDFFQDNVHAQGLAELTRREVVASSSVNRLLLLADGTPVLQVGRMILDMPLTPVELAAQLQSADANTVIVVLGVGAGNVLRGLRELSGSSILVYEPDPSNVRTLLSWGPSDLADIEIVTNLHDLTLAWSRFVAREVDAVLVQTPGYSQTYPEQTEQLKAAIESLMTRTWMSLNTTRNRARVWIEDIVDNVELLAHARPILSLARQFEGVPAFIVGAGPSLDKNIEALTEAAQKGIVFATNSGALALGARGIEPQVLVCLESIDASTKLEKLPFIDRCVRAISLSAAPRSLRTGRGPLLPFFEGLPQYGRALSDLAGCPPVAVCSSVSTAAFSIARQLGCNPIVLVGQDMAYSDGKAYAKGTGYETSTAIVDPGSSQINLTWEPGLLALHGTAQGSRPEREPHRVLRSWDGQGTVSSGLSFASIHGWLQSTAEVIRLTEPNLRLINATEGGAYVEGFEHLPLRELLATLPTRGITSAELVDRARARRPSVGVEAVAGWLQLHARAAERTRRAARRVLRHADLAAQVTAAARSPQIARAYARLEQAEAALRASVYQSPLIDAWAHNAVREASQDVSTSADSYRAAALSSTQASMRIARAVEVSAGELREHIERALARLKSAPAQPSLPVGSPLEAGKSLWQ